MQNPRLQASRQPRYLQIYQALRDRIADGTVAMGQNLPSEADLCAEFGTSRFTVREALRKLQADGMVARQHGAGSRVVRTAPASSFGLSFGSVDDVLLFASDTGFELLEAEPLTLNEVQAASFGGSPGARWTRVRGLRCVGTDRSPFALIESFIAPRFADLLDTLLESRPPFYRAVEQAAVETVTDVVQKTQALSMPRYVADALGAPHGSVSLRIFRIYRSVRGTIVASYNWHFGGERFAHHAHLQIVDGRQRPGQAPAEDPG